MAAGPFLRRSIEKPTDQVIHHDAVRADHHATPSPCLMLPENEILPLLEIGPRGAGEIRTAKGLFQQ